MAVSFPKMLKTQEKQVDDEVKFCLRYVKSELPFRYLSRSELMAGV